MTIWWFWPNRGSLRKRAVSNECDGAPRSARTVTRVGDQTHESCFDSDCPAGRTGGHDDRRIARPSALGRVTMGDGSTMEHVGGCQCGEVRYRAKGPRD